MFEIPIEKYIYKEAAVIIEENARDKTDAI